ncbi:MAG: hydrogenase expression/formation protein HypE [Thermoanaerobaculales bacterium]|jgi:hydrogenase expression/formation protein HypE|nr:hydrogenase expression/formation protein HypE [Thermoanaerobaculales bacterium]
MKKNTPRRLLLGHGSGGRLTHELVEGTFLPALNNPILASLTDAAVLPELPPGRPALTTDGFVVDPPIFPGGNLGELSVCGTVNDLAVAGARPLWLTWGLILEEGADGELIAACAAGTASAASEAGVQIVAGDTKVVPRGKGDRIYAVTAGLGVVPPGREISDARIDAGDVVIASGPLGDHGATIMAARHRLDAGSLVSDCAPLNGLIESVFAAGIDIHSMHDPTRGGVLTVCNEVAERSGKRLILSETAIPVRPQVRAVCEVLGLEVLGLACEGRVLAWVHRDQADAALDAFRAHPQGAEAAIFARVEDAAEGAIPVVMETEVGSTRPLDMLSGSDLPRIC